MTDPFGVIATLQQIAADIDKIGFELHRTAIALAPLGGLVADFAHRWMTAVFG